MLFKIEKKKTVPIVWFRHVLFFFLLYLLIYFWKGGSWSGKSLFNLQYTDTVIEW